jgi:hypothetical protein
MKTARLAVIRWTAAAAVGLAALAPAAAQPIVEVLERSATQRLQALTVVPRTDPRASTLHADFDRLLALASDAPPVELRVVDGPLLAECFLGRIVAVNADLARLPEGERLFVLAHELGHAVQGHWQAMGRVYSRHIPGPVTPEHTDPVTEALGRDMAALSQRNELDADAWGLTLLRAAGFDSTDAVRFFVRGGLRRGTPTHPGTLQRVAALVGPEMMETAEGRMLLAQARPAAMRPLD